jgi:ubiquinone/menaquinone biosynthesis C-methylase UbiE
LPLLSRDLEIPPKHLERKVKLKLSVSNFPRDYDASVLEMMDRKDPDPLILKDDLANIRKMNRLCGAYRLIRSELDILKNQHGENFFKSNSPVTFLDFCTGSGDIPRAIATWAREHSFSVQITGADINHIMLETSKEESRHYSEIQFEQSNILKPQFAENSFDFVLCNLALHHFSAEQAVTILQNMWQISRKGIVINDLVRTRALCLLTKYFVPLVTSNPFTRFDADLSVRRAFTTDEMLKLAFHAKIPNPEIRKYFLGRQVLSALKTSRSPAS